MFKALNLQDGKNNHNEPENGSERVKCLIIGSGPAGYTAAIYAARANLHPVMYEGLQPGGQLTTTTEVENYPGYPEGVTGPVMMEDFKKQAERFGTDIRFGLATKVDFSGPLHKVWIDGKTLIEAETVIIATGICKIPGYRRRKEIRGRRRFGLRNCDGLLYRERCRVVGGGDTAAEEAIYLAGLAKSLPDCGRDELRPRK